MVYVALVALAIGQVGEIGAQDPSSGICGVTTAEAGGPQTWLPDNPTFRRVAEYGKSSEQWIGSYGGLALHDDELFVFDHGRPEILVLSAGALLVVRRFGREGEGPGVQLWSDDGSKPARVAVINPNDGSFRDVTAPLFPRAFGPSNSFFAVERGSAHEAYIVKYVVTNED